MTEEEKSALVQEFKVTNSENYKKIWSKIGVEDNSTRISVVGDYLAGNNKIIQNEKVKNN